MKDFIDLHLDNHLFFSDRISFDDYDICYSNLIDDAYYNYAFIKNSTINLEEVKKDIINKLSKYKRNFALYVPSNIMNDNLLKKLTSYQHLYTDSWLTFYDLTNFQHYKSDIDFDISIVDKSNINDFAKVTMQGFSSNSDDDPYNNLCDGYVKQIENSINIKDDIRIIHFMGMISGKIIATATAVYKGNMAIIYNVTTNPKYQRKGICRSLMSYIMNYLAKNNVIEVCTQTEENFYTEKVYESMGFKKKMLGKVYLLQE